MSRWSIHPTLLPFETLSSWIKRIAESHLNNIPDVINEKSLRYVLIDVIDNNPSSELLDHLSLKTGYSVDELKKHTMIQYDNNFPKINGVRSKLREGMKFANSYSERFMLSVRRSQTNGNRFCPLCLKENMYFRIYWKLGYYTACHIHNILLHNKCSICSKPVNYFNNTTEMSKCRICKNAWENTQTNKVDTEVVKILHKAFLDQKSPYEDCTSTEFLGYFWNAYSHLRRRDEEYLKQLYKINNIEYDVNEMKMNHNLQTIVWKLFWNKYISYDKPVPCLECEESFKRNSMLLRHQSFHNKPKIRCDNCNEQFHQMDQLIRHRKVHYKGKYACKFCGSLFRSKVKRSKHIQIIHFTELEMLMIDCIRILQSQKKEISVVAVSNNIEISRSLFNNYQSLKELVTKGQE